MCHVVSRFQKLCRLLFPRHSHWKSSQGASMLQLWTHHEGVQDLWQGQVGRTPLGLQCEVTREAELQALYSVAASITTIHTMLLPSSLPLSILTCHLEIILSHVISPTATFEWVYGKWCLPPPPHRMHWSLDLFCFNKCVFNLMLESYEKQLYDKNFLKMCFIYVFFLFFIF